MTQLMETLIKELSDVPKEEQDDVAAFLLEDLRDEKRWDELFASSQDQLARLADEALEEFERGETKPLEESFRVR